VIVERASKLAGQGKDREAGDGGCRPERRRQQVKLAPS
jgi:hypothetical protein